MSTFDQVTLPGWPLPPGTPTGLNTTAGDSQVTLNWSAASEAAAYKVKRSNLSGGPYGTVASNITSLTYTNNGLDNGILYHFVASAVNIAGESDDSSEASARPVSLNPPRLGSTPNGGQIQLSWPLENTGWRLEAQTNELSTGLTPDWYTVPASDLTNVYNLVPAKVTGSVLLRLAYP